MKINPLTKKEQEIMDILWNANESMSTYDIKMAAPHLVACTIQQTIPKLLKKDYIKVADFGYTKNSVTRKYVPIITQADYLKSLANEKSSLQFVTNYIEDSNHEILSLLEKKIQEKLKEVKGK